MMFFSRDKSRAHGGRWCARAVAFALLALLAVVFLPVLSGARAADVAERGILGFSGDGRFFAFMEFGVQDGSGAPYGAVFIIDLERDRFVPGTPVRVAYGEEVVPLSRALLELKRRAAPMLARLGIILPGRVLATNAAAEAGGDMRELAFFAHPALRRERDIVRYRVRAVSMRRQNPDCARLALPPERGLRLERFDGARWRIVHEDARVPRSRGCPSRYELADVIAGPDIDMPRWHVLLVRYFRPGFEGADGRYLAIPVRLRENRGGMP